MELKFNQEELNKAIQENDFDALPPNTYAVVVSKSEEKTSKAGNKYLSLEYTVTEGDFEGRKCWDNFNVNHESAQVRAISYRKLDSLCKACGKVVQEVTNSEDLEQIEIKIKTSIDKEKRTRIDRYFGINEDPIYTNEIGKKGVLEEIKDIPF